MLRLKIILLLAACAALLAGPVLAGSGTIRETDTEIIVEYYGSDEDFKEAAVIREKRAKTEEEKKLEIEKKDRVNQKRAARKAARGKDDEE
jgi:hypothetical protein